MIHLLADDNQLFRQQALDARSFRLYGEVILRQSFSTRLITAIVVVVVALAGLWATVGSYARIEAVRGVLVPVEGYSKIYAPRPGVVTALRVKEGDRVKLGQKLAVIQIENPQASGAMGSSEALGSIDNQISLAKQQVALLNERSTREVARLSGIIEGLRNQNNTVSQQIALQSQIVASMENNLARVKPVVDIGFISKIDYERRQQAVLSAQEDLSRLRQQAQGLESEIARSMNERAQVSLTGTSDQTNVRTGLEGYRQQHTRLQGESSYAVESPRTGRVTALQTGLGRSAEVQRPLMIVVPEDAPLRVNLYVPSRAIGFIRTGQDVRLLYDAFPYQRFGSYRGHVDTVSRLAIDGQETDAPFRIDEPVYQVTVRIDRQQLEAYGKTMQLQAGMTLVGNVVLERRSFLDWILDPLRSVSKRN